MREDIPKLIVGLGNPGLEYAKTKHNAGFLVIDRVLYSFSDYESKRICRSEVYESRHRGRRVVFAKPLTYMNRSGRALNQLARKYNVAPIDTLIVYDCVALPLGVVRLRKQGGSGGHNGMESVLHSLNTKGVPRCRVGIYTEQKEKVVDYVLTQFEGGEHEKFLEMTDVAADAVLYALRNGTIQAMNLYNSRESAEKEEYPDNQREGGDC